MNGPVVHVIDDDPAVRESTALMLELAGLAVRTWDTGTAFIAEAELRPNDCALLDLRMPGLSGLDVLRHCRASGRSPRIVIMTAHGEISSAISAMKGGAVDFIEKPYAEDDLLQLIRNAIDAGSGPTPDPASELVASLSRREREVLEQLIQGLANKEIAQILGLSVRTIELHRTKLLRRLGTRSVAVAVQMALRAGGLAQSRGR